MQRTRSTARRLLLGGALLAGAVVLVPLVVMAVLALGGGTSTVGTLDFARELRIPPLLEPRTDGAGRKVFDLRMQAGTSELVEGRRTPTWGFNGPHLGPTLRAARGDRVAMRVTNGLSQTSTVHWHGMHLPARADGGPHQTIAPGKTWMPSWTVDQPAATLWYHPHLHAGTEDHVYRGLAGMFILDDAEAEKLALPRRYGVDDIPLIVQDKRLDDDGALDFSKGMISPIGRLGDEILVNGTPNPHLDVRTAAVRLRLLNASTARTYDFGFSDDRAFDLIATDGGLLGAPARIDRVQLSPGERAEIVVRVRPGEDVVLRSHPPDLGDVGPLQARFVGARDSFDILELRAARRLAPSPRVPATLVKQQMPPREAQPRVRRFELGDRDINDRKMDMSRIDAVVPVDTTEIWEIRNASGMPHNFHVHDTRFQVLESDGVEPPPALRGLKDTVLVRPGETVRLATRFNDYTDPATPYMFHCHLLQHEDRGMMGQFVVVAPGDGPARGAVSPTPTDQPAASTRARPAPSLAHRRGDHQGHPQESR